MHKLVVVVVPEVGRAVSARGSGRARVAPSRLEAVAKRRPRTRRLADRVSVRHLVYVNDLPILFATFNRVLYLPQI